MNSATYSGQVLTRRNGEIVDQKDLGGTMKLELPLGNGKARVSQTRGLKHWLSDRDAGITVEATVTVQITCGQSEKAIRAAIESCGNIAEDMAVSGIKQMDQHIHNFAEDKR